MPTLSPHTLTRTEQSALLAVTAGHPRDHLAFSFALGTGLRLAEIVGLAPPSTESDLPRLGRTRKSESAHFPLCI